MRSMVLVCGVFIMRKTLDEVMDHIVTFSAPRSVVISTISLVNADSLSRASRDQQHRFHLNNTFCLADGWPVAKLARTERIAGADLMMAAARHPKVSRLRHVILGGRGVAYPAACAQWRVVPDRTGLTPPFIPDHAQPEDLLRWAQIPCDVLWVALGCPKQEAWIAANRHAIPAKVVIGIGAAVDFLAGRIQRAPRWIQRIGMEGVYRIYAEPSRWRRQVNAAVRFFVMLLGEPWPWVR